VFGVWRAEPNLSTFLSQWCDVASVRTDVDGNEVARTSSRQVAPRSATGACGGRWVGEALAISVSALLREGEESQSPSVYGEKVVCQST